MVRSYVVKGALLAAVAAVITIAPVAGQGQRNQPAATTPEARPFEALMPKVAATAPGTYVVTGTTLAPAPEAARIPVMLQADVLRGPEQVARVGIVVGAEAAQAVTVRVRALTVAAAGQTARVAADAGGSGAPGPLRLVREFNLAPGEYDLEAVVGQAGSDAGQTVAVAKSRLTVPNLRGSELAVTPLVVGDSQTGPRKTDLPFVFGRTTLTPSAKPDFSQDGSVSVAFRVYNWTAKAEEKPDLTVDYEFYQQGTKKLNFFNKMKPQRLSAEVLGDAFDTSAGVVNGGRMFPLAAFPFGEFEVRVRVTDNRTKQSTERQTRFSVVP